MIQRNIVSFRNLGRIKQYTVDEERHYESLRLLLMTEIDGVSEDFSDSVMVTRGC